MCVCVHGQGVREGIGNCGAMAAPSVRLTAFAAVPSSQLTTKQQPVTADHQAQLLQPVVHVHPHGSHHSHEDRSSAQQERFETGGSGHAATRGLSGKQESWRSGFSLYLRCSSTGTVQVLASATQAGFPNGGRYYKGVWILIISQSPIIINTRTIYWYWLCPGF